MGAMVMCEIYINILSSLFGGLFGFIFSILILYVKSKIDKNKKLTEQKQRYKDIRLMFLFVLDSNEVNELLPNYIISLSNNDIVNSLKCDGFKMGYTFKLQFEINTLFLILQNSHSSGGICSNYNNKITDGIAKDSIKILTNYIMSLNFL